MFGIKKCIICLLTQSRNDIDCDQSHFPDGNLSLTAINAIPNSLFQSFSPAPPSRFFRESPPPLGRQEGAGAFILLRLSNLRGCRLLRLVIFFPLLALTGACLERHACSPSAQAAGDKMTRLCTFLLLGDAL